MDRDMTGPTDDQSLAAECTHPPDPGRFLPPAPPVQASELADVVHLAPARRATHFASIGEKSRHEIAASCSDPGGSGAVVHHAKGLAAERKAAKLRHERSFVWPTLDADL